MHMGVPTIELVGPNAVSAPKSISVARTHVAMHQPVRMEQRERRGHVARVAARVAVGHLAELVEVSTLEQLHRVVRPGFGDAVVVDLDDARVLQAHERVVLALEQRFDLLALVRELRRP